MGFKRKAGKCAVGAMEASTQEADLYYDGRDFPYLDDNGSSSGIENIISDNTTIEYTNDVVTAIGSYIVVYNISGNAVASAKDSINLSRLPKGVYVIKATGGSVDSAVKVVR